MYPFKRAHLKSYERGEHVTIHIVRGAIELELDVTL